MKKGVDSKLPGWQPKENASQLPQEGELSKQRGWHQCTKGRGPESGAVGFYLVVAVTAGMRAGAVGVVSVLSPAPGMLTGWCFLKVGVCSFRFTHVNRECRRIHHLPSDSFNGYGVMCCWVRHCACLFGLKGIRCVADSLCMGAAYLSEFSCTNSYVKLSSTTWWSRE